MTDNLPADVSVNAQVEYAESKVGDAQSRQVAPEEIDALRAHCRAFIERAHLSQHTRAMALPKMDEMIFWIRSGNGRG